MAGECRELENTIERLVFSRGSVIDVSDLPFKASGPDLHERLFADLPSLDEIERPISFASASRSVGARAAEVLGIDRRTLYGERFSAI
jgi:DNA-binding NtrC family response regulator